MKVFAKSDIGKAREMNQDAYYASQPSDTVGLYIVADGMGGYNGGEVASTLAVNSVKNYIQSNFADESETKEKILDLIKNAIEFANMLVYEKSKEVPELFGMGTTIEVALVYNNKVYIGHIGDSRIYRIRKNFIRKLTTDHSYVEKLVKDGTISREEAVHHPKKNMITKAVGCKGFAEPDIFVKNFLKDDILVITSDGLTNMVKDEEIYNVITENIENATEKLIDKANNAGGLDNITVIIVLNKNDVNNIIK